MVAPFWCCGCEPVEPDDCVSVQIDTCDFTAVQCCMRSNATMTVNKLEIDYALPNQFQPSRRINGLSPPFTATLRTSPSSFGLVRKGPFRWESDVIELIVTIRHVDTGTTWVTNLNAQYIIDPISFFQISGRFEVSAESTPALDSPEAASVIIASQRAFCGITAELPGDFIPTKNETSVSCGRLTSSVRGQQIKRLSNFAPTYRPTFIEIDIDIDGGPCCRGPNGVCIASGVAKSESGWCCPISEFDTMTLNVITAPTYCTTCLEFESDAEPDGKYTTIPNVAGTHYLTKVGSPPGGIDHQWQKKVTGLIWSDGTTFDGSCGSLVARSAGDMVLQVSQVGTQFTIEILMDVTDPGPGGTFTDTAFRASFAHPADCDKVFGGVLSNILTTSNWDCPDTAGGDEIDPTLDLDMGHGGSVNLFII